MERRKALTFAGVVTATVAAGTFALAANFGLLSTASADTEAGELDAGDVDALVVRTTVTEPETPNDPEIIVIDEYVTDPAPAAPNAPAVAPSNVEQPGTAATHDSASEYDRSYEDEDHDGDDRSDEGEDHDEDDGEDDEDHDEDGGEDDEDHDGDDDDD